MENKITNLEVQDFLKDFAENSETMVLEEGKQKDELIESARKRGIIISKNDRDLGVIKTIYCFTSKANSNKVRLPKKEFVKIFPQIVGRPMDYGHNRQFILGFYIDYKYVLKDEKAIAYAIFFKSVYPKIWEKAKKFQKANKLSSSFEIWSPEDKRENLKDGTYYLHDMAIAGGALIFEEKGERPAYKDAKVLSLAKNLNLEQCVGKDCLVYASKYKPEEIIISSGDYFKDSVDENLKKIQEEKKIKIEETKKEEPKPENKTEAPKVEDKKIKVEPKVEPKVEVKKEETPKIEEKKVEPQNSKIKCSNCGHEWEIASQIEHKMGSEKCPKCLAILKQDGTMIHPPQIIDFKVSCPSCGMNNWLLLARNDTDADVRCLCKKEYKITFAEIKDKEMLDKIQFPYSGSTSCPQCGKWMYYEGISGITSRQMKCPKCELTFSFDITKSKGYKKISEIKAIDIIEKSSEIGGKKTMEYKLELSKYHRNVDDFEALDKALIDIEEATKDAKILTTEERNALPDSDFAVVVRVKNEKTGKTRKIRMYPIHDEAHVRNALARLGQDAPKATLKKLGVSIDKVKVKILKKARQLKMTDLLKRYEKASDVVTEKVEEKKIEKTPEKVEKTQEVKEVKEEVKVEKIVEQPEVKETSKIEETPKTETPKIEEKSNAGLENAISQIVELKKKIAKQEKETASKIEFYKSNAKKINQRREELDGFDNDLTDEQILDDDKFEKAKLEKENIELKTSVEKSSEIVGLKKKEDGYYSQKRKEIDNVAFPKEKEK